jgi:uncharacterized membrane-anchored protein YhcB (DUF1043 family)
MATGEHDFTELISEIAQRERRAFRRSWTYSGIGLLVAVLWLSLTVYKTKQLGDQAAALNEQIAENTKKLDQQNKAIKENQRLLDKLASARLKDFGGEPSTKVPGDNTQIEQTLEADSARQQIVSATNGNQRENITIEYFWKDVDKYKVEKALKELGFKEVVLKTPVNPWPTNAIWFGRQVNPKDATLVAFTLIRAGVVIKEIRYFKPSSPRANSSLIQVGSDPALLAASALTVEGIRNKTQFEADSKSN